MIQWIFISISNFCISLLRSCCQSVFWNSSIPKYPSWNYPLLDTKWNMSFTFQNHCCINIYLTRKSWGYERGHGYWWDKNCLNFHEFTSGLVFGACPHFNWHVAVRIVWNSMNYAGKTTHHVPHYNHIVLCNFRAATLEKYNTSDSSSLINIHPQLCWGIRWKRLCFL